MKLEDVVNSPITGARRGNFAFYVMNDNKHKKKCLYVYKYPNELIHCATFRDDETAEYFMMTMREIIWGEVTE